VYILFENYEITKEKGLKKECVADLTEPSKQQWKKAF